MSLAPADSQQMEDIFNEEFTIGIVHSEEIQFAGNAAEVAAEADAKVDDDATDAAATADDHTGNVLGNYHHYLSSFTAPPPPDTHAHFFFYIS